MNSDSSLLEGFAYPIGYIPTATPISDPEILSGFQPFEIPYVITGLDGQPTVDPRAPVAVRRLRNGQCPNLQSALRYVEIGGGPDDAMKATYHCEDIVARACDFSEAGFHGTAIELIRSLPEPFQRTAAALKATVDGCLAQSRYEDALQAVHLLIDADDVPTKYARRLYRLEEVQTLLLLGRLNEAEEILDQRRSEFREHYEYYGIRAAAALLKGDELLARTLVVKAGRVDAYHCYKILWNPLLKPIEVFIKRELLTEAGTPRIYEQDMEMYALCTRIQGALLVGDRARAHNLAEGIILHRVTEWTSAEQANLALAGLGAVDAMLGGADESPGWGMASMVLARRIARAIRTGDDASIEMVANTVTELDCDDEVKALLVRAVRVLALGEEFSIPATLETPLAEVADKWRQDSRNLYVIHGAGGRFQLCKMREPRERRAKDWETTDLREIFPVIENSEFSSPLAAELWIEEKLAANASLAPGSFLHRVFKIHLDGWGLLLMLKPSRKSTPLLQEAWEIASRDPNFHFHNGPADSFGLQTSFALRLLRMLGVRSAIG